MYSLPLVLMLLLSQLRLLDDASVYTGVAPQIKYHSSFRGSNIIPSARMALFMGSSVGFWPTGTSADCNAGI